MKNLIAFVSICFMSAAGVSFADETLFDKTKALVDKVEPRGGVFFNRKNHTIQGYTAAQLLTAEVSSYQVDGVLGYGIDKTVLAGVETDVLAAFSTLPGVTLKIPWFKVNAGFVAGYSIEDDAVAYGPVLNGSVKW